MEHAGPTGRQRVLPRPVPQTRAGALPELSDAAGRVRGMTTTSTALLVALGVGLLLGAALGLLVAAAR
ncbi:MAG: hypothetical protein M3P93_14770, partial [Actinomycetota bacterium]|nr:hypothetical protein [Actinomycetota bacterium]